MSDCVSNREAARRDDFCPADARAKRVAIDVTAARDGTPLLGMHPGMPAMLVFTRGREGTKKGKKDDPSTSLGKNGICS